MSRQQKRAAQRQMNKKSKIINQFTQPQLAVIEEIVQQGTAERTERRIEEIVAAIDRSISAYFFLRFEDMTCEEVRKEQEILSDLLDEDGEKLGLILKECGGNEIMAKKKFEKYEEDVRKACEELLDQKVKQSEAKKVLQDKFPMLSSAILMNAFKKCKEARKAEQEEDPEIVAATEYIFGEDEKNTDTKVKEDKKEEFKPVVKEKKTEPKVETHVKEDKPVQAKQDSTTKLEIISKQIIVKGEFGTYTKSDKGVSLEGYLYEDCKKIEEDEKETVEKLENIIMKTQESMRILEAKIKSANDSIKVVKGKANELKAVMEIA